MFGAGFNRVIPIKAIAVRASSPAMTRTGWKQNVVENGSSFGYYTLILYFDMIL
jgi:hypothetical protein